MNIIKKLSSIESFETARLLAVKLTIDDFDKLMQMHTDAVVMATLGGIRSAEKTRENLEWNLNQWRENGFGLWMFYLKSTHEWIGRGGIRRINLNGQEEIEIAYALMPQFWHCGYATEITKACIEIAFEVLRLKNVICFTLPTNKASRRVMEKSGFQYERDLVINYDGIDYPHVLYRIKNYRKAEVVSYNSHWPDLFTQEAKQIQDALGTLIKKIHHIGSTAIPNMPAKRIIDMLLECDDIGDMEVIKNKLHPLGYLFFSRQVMPHRSFFTRKHRDDIGFHLHFYERGDPQVKRHVSFRDYLIAHPQDAHTYAKLKLKLAEQFKDDMNNYVAGKDKLVQEIDIKAKIWAERCKNYPSPNLGIPIKYWSEEKLIKAMVANFNIHKTYFAQYLKSVELVRIPGYTIVNSSLRNEIFNYVLDCDFTASQTSHKIAEITNYFKNKNLPFSWWISPYDHPESLAALLQENDYQNTENNVAMYLDLDSWSSSLTTAPELKIIRARDKKTLQDFALVWANDAQTFKTYFSWIAEILTDDDPIEYYVGYVDEKPVVRGLTCYYAGVAGLHWLTTVADEQKKGYGTAMQQYRLKRAKELGYHVAVLQASPRGLSLYKRLGYKECGVFQKFKI